MANNWRNFCTKLCAISSCERNFHRIFENNNVVLLPFNVFARRSCSHCETSLILESFPVSLYYKVNPSRISRPLFPVELCNQIQSSDVSSSILPVCYFIAYCHKSELIYRSATTQIWASKGKSSYFHVINIDY